MSRPDDPPIEVMRVLKWVLYLVRQNPTASRALNEYDADNPHGPNVGVRWLPRKRGFEVTLRFDAETFAAIDAEHAASEQARAAQVAAT